MIQRLALCVGVASLVAACGEPLEQVAEQTMCSEFRPVQVIGEVGDILVEHVRVEATLARDDVVGQLTSRRITILLGEVEYTPAGGSPEMRPQIMTFQTNIEGRSPLQEAIAQRRIGFGNEFDVIDKPDDTYCDPTEGELCVRFGLDNTENNELVSDSVIHTGQSGKITVDTFTAGRIKMRLDVEFGSNIKNEFDDETCDEDNPCEEGDSCVAGLCTAGRLEGCFDVRVGVERSGEVPLEVPCSEGDPRDICNQGGQ
jgi:hypothetical protein